MRYISKLAVTFVATWLFMGFLEWMFVQGERADAELRKAPEVMKYFPELTRLPL